MKKNNIYTIQTIVRVSIVLVLLFVFLNVNAQPAKQYYGCKNSHHHHLSKAPELTQEE